jgi:hypothetical protein
MRFLLKRAKDVALPTACLMFERLFPHVKEKEREELMRELVDFLTTAVRVYCELHPTVPEPSSN